jgi:hypothetical protein
MESGTDTRILSFLTKKGYNNITIIKRFDTSSPGWELDYEGFIVEAYKDSIRFYLPVLTNHNNPYIAAQEEIHEIVKRKKRELEEILEVQRLISEIE